MRHASVGFVEEKMPSLCPKCERLCECKCIFISAFERRHRFYFSCVCVLAMPRSSFTRCRPAHAYITHARAHKVPECIHYTHIHAAAHTCTRLFARCESGYHTIKLGTHALTPNVVHHRPTAATTHASSNNPAVRGSAARIWPAASSVNNPVPMHWLMHCETKPANRWTRIKEMHIRCGVTPK